MEKLIVHGEVPEFDQQTQYVVELPPVEREDCIYIGCEVKDMELIDEAYTEQTNEGLPGDNTIN